MHRRDLLRAGAGALALPGAARGGTRRARRVAHHAPGRTTSQDGYAPLGTVPLATPRGMDVADDGGFAYVSLHEERGGGFAVVDLADPGSPEVVAARRSLLGGREDGPLSSVAVAVSGDRLLVGGPNFAVSGQVWAVLLYDVSDPANPRRLAVRETDHAVHNVALDGSTAYVTGTFLPDGPVVVLDASGGEFAELTRWSIVDADPAWGEVSRLMRSCHDVTVRGDTAYAPHLEAGTWILDVSDPASPEPLGHVGPSPAAVSDAEADDREVALTELPGNAHSAAPSEDGDVVAIAHEAWDHPGTTDRGGPGGVVLWDVADPAAPTRLARIGPPPTPDPTQDGPWMTAHNVEIAGDRLYSGWFHGGVMVHDVGDPADPRRLAWWRRPDEAAFWSARVAVPGEFFVAPSTGRGDTRTALYAFPDRAGEQADPPALATRETTRDETTTSTRATSSTEDTTTPTRSPTDGDRAGTTTGGQPGFGVLPAMAGLGVGAWLAARRRT